MDFSNVKVTENDVPVNIVGTVTHRITAADLSANPQLAKLGVVSDAEVRLFITEDQVRGDNKTETTAEQREARSNQTTPGAADTSAAGLNSNR